MQPLQAGQLFADRYRVLRCLASGGMGSVHEAVHVETERVVALKVLLPSLVDQPELRDRFRAEARITAPIQCEEIVQVLDAGVDGATGMPYLVMEMLRGETLHHRIERSGPLPSRVACSFLAQLAAALDKAHEAQIVHRDLKPENLFLTRRDDGTEQLKILDFGLAKIVQANAARNHATSSVGTPLYMAPEQFNTGIVTSATDVYALGMLTYTMLVGEPYWAAESTQARTLVAFAMIVTGGPRQNAVERAAEHGITLPPAYDDWFLRAIAIDPSQRPRKATIAVAQLARALGVDLPVSSSSVREMTRRSSNLGPLPDRNDSASSAAKTALATSVDGEPPPRTTRRPTLIVVAVVLMSVAVAFGIFLARSASPIDARAVEETAGPPTIDATSSASTTTPPPSTPPSFPLTSLGNADSSTVVASASARRDVPPIKGPRVHAPKTAETVVPPAPTGNPLYTRE